MTEDTSSRRDDASIGTGFGRRRFIAVGSGVGAALLAGCTSGDSGGDGTPTEDGSDGSGGGETANFRLLVSDAPADIDDFDRLDVTFSKARVFQGGGDGESTETEPTDGETEPEGTETAETGEAETATRTVEEDQQQQTGDGDATENGTATEDGTATETDAEGTEPEETGDGEGDRGFYVLELDSPTVDLTQVVGDVAQPVFDGELEAGSYQKLELHVEEVEGVADGETVEVKVPSNKLQLTKPFEVRAGEALDFVFDINVVKRGNEASYNLKPVISQSGVRGEDVEVEETGGSGSAGSGNVTGGSGGSGNETTDGDNQGGAGGQSGGGASNESSG